MTKSRNKQNKNEEKNSPYSPTNAIDKIKQIACTSPTIWLQSSPSYVVISAKVGRNLHVSRLTKTLQAHDIILFFTFILSEVFLFLNQVKIVVKCLCLRSAVTEFILSIGPLVWGRSRHTQLERSYPPQGCPENPCHTS